jgi:hypothetical protein
MKRASKSTRSDRQVKELNNRDLGKDIARSKSAVVVRSRSRQTPATAQYREIDMARVRCSTCASNLVIMSQIRRRKLTYHRLVRPGCRRQRTPGGKALR